MNMEKVGGVHVEMQFEVHKRHKMMQKSVMNNVVCEEVRYLEPPSSRAGEWDGETVVVTD
jgi:hypothetical protein